MRSIQSAARFLIVLIVLADVFGSILVPRPTPRGVRVGPWLVRAVAPVWRRVADRLPSRRIRQDFRGSLGPALLVLSLGMWVLLLTLGFALMLHADPQNVALPEYGFDEALFQRWRCPRWGHWRPRSTARAGSSSPWRGSSVLPCCRW